MSIYLIAPRINNGLSSAVRHLINTTYTPSQLILFDINLWLTVASEFRFLLVQVFRSLLMNCTD